MNFGSNTRIEFHIGKNQVISLTLFLIGGLFWSLPSLLTGEPVSVLEVSLSIIFILGIFVSIMVLCRKINVITTSALIGRAFILVPLSVSVLAYFLLGVHAFHYS